MFQLFLTVCKFFFFSVMGNTLTLLKQKDKLHSVMHIGMFYQTRNFL